MQGRRDLRRHLAGMAAVALALCPLLAAQDGASGLVPAGEVTPPAPEAQDTDDPLAQAREALLEACPQRLRPVLMTSLTIVLALLPAALGFGAGADTNGPLAVAVIGGMVSSTLLTLVVVPAVYSLIMGGVARPSRYH